MPPSQSVAVRAPLALTCSSSLGQQRTRVRAKPLRVHTPMPARVRECECVREATPAEAEVAL
eukprot:5293307-Pleurochrysis_carterae.AAC.1